MCSGDLPSVSPLLFVGPEDRTRTVVQVKMDVDAADL